MSRRVFTIDEALKDPNLLGAALGDPSSWQTWFTVLKAAFGQELSRSERRAFAAVAGSRKPPKQRIRELWAVAGRRCGKSRIAAALAVYFAAFIPHKLAPGERGMVLVLAASQEQARATFDYAKAFLMESPVLRNEVADMTRSEIRLRNGIVIGIHTNSFRTIRSRTLLMCIFDEIAFWRDETSATPDQEVLTAVMPSFVRSGNAPPGLLVALSSPYRKTGLLYTKHKDHFGVDKDGVLVVQGTSQQFNTTLSDEVIQQQREASPETAPSEWDALFRSDRWGFLSDEDIDNAIDHDRPRELAPKPGVIYFAFTDPNGGGRDAYTIAIGHREGELIIIDVVRSQHGTPRKTTLAYAELCRQYGIKRVVGDNYAKLWVQDTWRETGIVYEKAEQPAAQLYLEAQPNWVQGAIRMYGDPVLLKELRHLECIPGRVGRDQVTHPRNMHDDMANAVCGVITLLAARSKHPPPEFFENGLRLLAIRGGSQRSGYVSLGERATRLEARLGERRYAQLTRGRRF
jgi:hypothetical protein